MGSVLQDERESRGGGPGFLYDQEAFELTGEDRNSEPVNPQREGGYKIN